ncbi:transcriptional repressor NrdR [Candidatus Berkelbacteria bacterium]|nr:transcriptional repressor NrdR [Candidatus Berkelbacteria bacterium]
MLCPNCHKNNSAVIESRDSGGDIRRRRICLDCRHRFTTYEKIEVPNLAVLKKDGRKEPFVRHKILSGIAKACEKRPCFGEAEEITSQIEDEVYALGKTEIESKVIGEKVLEKLKETDKVAYLRFASVYRSFESPEQFEEELDQIKNRD